MYLFPLWVMSTAEMAEIVFINVSEALKASDRFLTECSLTKRLWKLVCFFFFLIIIIYYSSLISLTYCVSFYIRIVFGLASDTLFQPFIICLGGCTLQDNVLIWIYKNILFKKMLREMSFLCADLNLYQKHFYEPRITMKTLQSLGLFPINQW